MFKNKNKVVKPYTRLQNQGHVKKGPTVVTSLMRIACLVAERIQRFCVCLCRPTVTLHQGQGHRDEHEHILYTMASISRPSC